MKRPRNKQSEQPNPEKSQNSSGSVIVVEAPKYTPQEIKTFKQQACEVLDILDKTGDGIYDEGRYPGMYLKHNRDVLSKSIIDKMSKKEDKEENDEDNIKLLNFFKNQKK